MQTTTQRWIVSLIIVGVTAMALTIAIKQAALFFWSVAMLAIFSALILVLKREPQAWWFVLILFILGAFCSWLVMMR